MKLANGKEKFTKDLKTTYCHVIKLYAENNTVSSNTRRSWERN